MYGSVFNYEKVLLNGEKYFLSQRFMSGYNIEALFRKSRMHFEELFKQAIDIASIALNIFLINILKGKLLTVALNDDHQKQFVTCKYGRITIHYQYQKQK